MQIAMMSLMAVISAARMKTEKKKTGTKWMICRLDIRWERAYGRLMNRPQFLALASSWLGGEDSVQ